MSVKNRRVAVGVAWLGAALLVIALGVRVAAIRPPKRELTDAARAADNQTFGHGLNALLSSAPGAGAAPETAAQLTLEGQVVDEDDFPVAGAVVSASLHERVVQDVRSDASGTFFLKGLTAATYQFLARSEDRVAGPIELAVEPDSEPITLRVRAGASVRVRVLDARTEAPVLDANAELTDVIGATAHADGQGTCALTGLPGGRHLIHVTAPGFESNHSVLHLIEGADAAREITVRLAAGAEVSGSVIDEHAQPVKGARVRFTSVSSAANEDPKSAVITDAEGRFSFAAVAAGSKRLDAEHNDFGVGHSDTLLLDGKSPTKAVVVRLAKGAMLYGRVIDSAHAGIASARVVVTPQDGGIGAQRGVDTDATGHFVLRGLPKVESQVVGISGLARSKPELVDLSQGSASVELTVDAEQSLSGVVVDAQGEPVANAQVAATKEDTQDDRLPRGYSSAVTNEDGQWKLTGLQAGEYRVRAAQHDSVSSPNFWLRRGTLARAGASDVKLVMESGSVVTGKVVFRDGEIPSQFSVALTLSAARPIHDAAGVFSLRDTPAGVHTLTISGEGIAPMFIDDITVANNTTVDLGTITLARSRTLQGQVLDAHRRPVAGAEVNVAATLLGDGAEAFNRNSGLEALHGLSDEAGTFVIKNLPDVPLVAAAQHRQLGRSHTLSISRTDPAPSVQLVLQPTASLVGTVSRDGKGVANAFVSMTETGVTRANSVVKTDSDGHYEFSALPPGTYLLVATQPGALARTSNKSQTLSLSEGERAEADIRLPGGQVALTLDLRDARTKAPIPNAQSYLLSGHVSASRAGELESAIAARGEGTSYISGAANGQATRFEGVEPAEYSLCVVGIFADLRDPAAAHRLMRDPTGLPVACVPLAVANTPAQQSQTVLLPM